MFYGEGGPGVGGFGEAESPESVTAIGIFLGENIYEIKDGEFYKYASFVEKCADCGEVDYYEPKCTCESLDNYVYDGMFTRYLDWKDVGEKETYMTIEVKWTMTDYYKDIYENILLSFEVL